MNFAPLPENSPQNPLVARFQLTSDDLKAAQKIHRNQKIWPRLLLGISVFVIVAMQLLLFTTTGHLPTDILIPLGIFLAIFAFLIWKARKTQTQGLMFRHETQTEFSIENVINSYSVTSLNVGWRDVVKVNKSATHLLIYVTQTTMIIVPRRAFENDADFENFGNFAFSQWQNALPAPTSAPPIAAI